MLKIVGNVTHKLLNGFHISVSDSGEKTIELSYNDNYFKHALILLKFCVIFFDLK